MTQHLQPLAFAFAFLVLTSFIVSSCSHRDDCAATSTCAAPGDSVQDASTSGDGDGGRVYPEVPPPSGCTPEGDTKDAAGCAVDVYALFVDPANGDDKNPGSKAAPLKTLAAATNIDTLKGRPRIYACADAKVEESVVLPSNVSLIGGYACGTWSASDKPTKIQPVLSSHAIALRVSSSTKRVWLSDLDIVSNNATSPVGESASSVAVLVTSATATFRRVLMTAGDGTSAGPAFSFTSNNATANPAGKSATGAMGGVACVGVCVVGTSNGGKGGDANAPGGAGATTPTPMSQPGINDGSAGSGGATCTSGRPGANGAAGQNGGKAALVVGALTIDGWNPTAGANGAVGNPGGAGGGGGGNASVGGGGGGCGGCGGAGGVGGKGGGGSIALALLESDVTLVACTLKSAKAGDGQDGGNAEKGLAGGAGGTSTGSGCGGGEAGNGAGGGGGAGGAGGASVAVARRGGNFTKDVATKLILGLNGFAGKPGKSETGGVNGNPVAPSGEAGEPGPDLLFTSPEILSLP